MDLNYEYEHVVVGAGIMGSWTAYHLAKRGRKVLLIEQFTLPHSRGSSHGQSRIIRKAYSEPFHCSMMVSAYEQWRRLEKETGKELLVETGLLCLASPSSAHHLEEITTSLADIPSSKYKKLSAAEMKAAYPQINYSDDYSVAIDYEGGILRADKCLRTVQDAFVKAGGHLWDASPVSSIESLGKTARVSVTVNGEQRTVTCQSVVIAAGSWAGRVLESLGLQLPLVPSRVLVFYWRKKDKNSFPNVTFIDFDEDTDCYGLPELEYPGLVKICKHERGLTNPDYPDLDHNSQAVDSLEGYIKKHFPGLEPKPALIERCMYTMTPDEIAIMDVHPEHKNIVFGCGYSGSGFKLSPVVGDILADLAQEKIPKHDMAPFSSKRFG